MQVERHQGVAGAVDLADEAADLLGVKQEFRVRTGSAWTWVEAAARGLMCAPIRKISSGRRSRRPLELGAPGADGLDLPPLQLEPCLVALLDKVVVQGLAILDDRHDGPLPIEFSILQR